MNSSDAAKLVDYIHSIPYFKIAPDETYHHMGAVITDAILQAGTRYDTVVRPRVLRVMAMAEGETTSGFWGLLQKKGAGAILDWQDSEKINRVTGFTNFLRNLKIETAAQFREWLALPGSRDLLMTNRGVGPKTADYFSLLVGHSTAAVDRHLIHFLELAGIHVSDYQQAQKIIIEAARILNVPARDLDHSIWLFMSKKASGNFCR